MRQSYMDMEIVQTNMNEGDIIKVSASGTKGYYRILTVKQYVAENMAKTTLTLERVGFFTVLLWRIKGFAIKINKKIEEMLRK